MNKSPQHKGPLTHEEFRELIDIFFNKRKFFSDEQYTSAKEVHPLDAKTLYGVSHIATANFLFRCETCTDIGMDIQWYQVILNTLGGHLPLQRHTSEEDLRKGYDGLNLSKILKEDKTNYQISGINFIKDLGYVCDHCKDSIFDN